MTAITRSMIKELNTPDDGIREENGVLIAEIDHFEMKNGLLVPTRTKFAQAIGEALSPFHYLKPTITGGDLLSPETAWEDTPREGYQVIGRVNDSARMSNHMDAFRNALIMGIEKDGIWETRYFPEGNLKPETWDEGNALLDINK